MLEFAISFWVRRRSFLMVKGSSGGNAYHERNAITIRRLDPDVEIGRD